MKTINLFEGVDLHIINAPKFKTNLMSVFFNIPLNRETVTQAALLPSVLKRGCKSYPTMRDLSRKLDDMYSASLSAGIRLKGDGEVLYFSSEYIADEYIGDSLTDGIAALLKEFIFSPVIENNGFLQSYVDSEKINLKNTILGLVNDKKEYAEQKCKEAMFDGCPYGMFAAGYIEDLDGITPQSLYTFYQSIISTAKVDIFISGNVNDSIISSIKNNLASAFTPRKADYISTEIAMPKNTAVNQITESADVVQSKLCMGFRCGIEPNSDEYNALVLASCIFGGSPFSKLFNNVREKLSLAYYATARTARFKSVMTVSSGIQTENYQSAYDEILLQFSKIQNGDIEDFEMEASKKYLKNSYNSLKDSLRGMEDYYLSQAIMGFSQSIDELLNEIFKVDKKRVCDVMKKVKLDTVFFLKGEGK